MDYGLTIFARQFILTRAEYYTKAAVFYDLSIPQFECSDSDPKRIIMADKICRDLGFAYRLQIPMIC